MDCRLPTGSPYGPSMQSCPASSLVQYCEEKSRGCGCCTESTPSGVALIATTKDPLVSDPSCTAITVPKTSHHDHREGGWGGWRRETCSGPPRPCLFNFDASSCSSTHPCPPTHSEACPACPVPCRSACPDAGPSPWTMAHPTPVQSKHPTIWACVGPLSVWNPRLKLGHLAIRAS